MATTTDSWVDIADPVELNELMLRVQARRVAVIHEVAGLPIPPGDSGEGYRDAPLT